MRFDQRTLGLCLRDTAALYPDRIAIEYVPAVNPPSGGSDVWTCTWKELDEMTDLLAARFRRNYNIVKGMHVGIWSMNSPSFVQTYLALTKLGAITNVFNTAYKAEEMAEVMVNSDTELLFYEGGFKGILFDHMIPTLRELAPTVRRYIHLDEKEFGSWLTPDSFTDREKESPLLAQIRKETEELPADSIISIIFTSGTTSRPKGVQLTHFGIVNTILRVQKMMRWTHEDKAVVAVSLFHGFGLNTGIAGCVVTGMTMHLLPSFRTAPVWDALDIYHCTVMLGVPSMYLALVRKEEYYDRISTSPTSGIVGGSDISYEEYQEIVKHFPNLHLVPSFGMTEASTSGSFCDYDDPCKGGKLTCGKFYEDSYARVADVTTGEVYCTNLIPGTVDPYLPAGSSEAGWPGPDKGANREGELQLAGFNIFKGYYKMPEETEKAFTKDGWFRSGDIGYFTENGDFVVSGRLKSLIIRSGENISPKEIEKAILASGLVEDVRVVGVPNTFTNEEIAACIIPKDKDEFPVNTLMTQLREKLSYFKVPKFLIMFKEFPMTASGKIRLGALKEKAAGLTDGRDDFCVLYAED